MDFSSEGLKKRALTLNTIVGGKRSLLPKTCSRHMKEQTERAYTFLNSHLNNVPIMRQCIKSVLEHNKTTDECLALFVVLFLDQLNPLKEDALDAQTMAVFKKSMGNIRIPVLPNHMRGVPSVTVRIELYLTSQDDTHSWDYLAFDPSCFTTHQDDMKTVQRRLHKELGVPKEVLSEVRSIVEGNPEAFADWVRNSDAIGTQHTTNALIGLMRSCNVCKKYGLTLPKCSGCKKVYYCSEQCQHSDWKEHKKNCN